MDPATQNFDVHVFQLRDANWAVRITGCGEGVVILKEDIFTNRPMTNEADALVGAAHYVENERRLWLERVRNARCQA